MTQQSSRRFLQTSLKLSKRKCAIVGLITFSGLVSLLGRFEIGYILLPLFVIAIIVFALWAPPIIGSWLLFGWVIMQELDIPAFGGFPRIPATTLLGALLLAALTFSRIKDGSYRQLLKASAVLYVMLFLLIFFLGYLGIYRQGKWNSLLVQTLAWQKLISCASVFFCGLLCCRDRADFRLILRAIPFWLFVYLLYIPPDVYIEFFREVLLAGSPYFVGLSYETLNTNILGQGAGIAAIISAVWCFYSRPRTHSRFMYGVLFLSAAALTLATASRQSILALLVGLAFMLFRGRRIVSTILIFLLFLISSNLTQKIESISAGSAYLSRIVDLGKSGDEWGTQSFSSRAIEIEMARPHLLVHPLLGYGFGGYSLAENIPDIYSRSELNESEFLHQLWEDGYPLVGEHNFPIALYIQTGALGVIAFMILAIGPYLRLRLQNRAMPPAERSAAYIDEYLVLTLGVVIFVLQNISGGLSLGSMSVLLFILGALVAALAGEKTGCLLEISPANSQMSQEQ